MDESPTGLNRKFKDTETGEILNRGTVANNIQQYDGYHVMKMGNKRVIRSNPNKSEKDNLG